MGHPITGPARGKPPCYGCQREDKAPGCHGRCEAYERWRKTVDEANGRRKEYYAKPPVKTN